MGRRHVENGFSLPHGPNNGEQRPLTPLQRLLAYQYDIGHREASVGLGQGGFHGTSVRAATASEVSTVLNGGNHQPIDSSLPKAFRLSHGDYARAAKQRYAVPDQPPVPFEADFAAQKADRERRKLAERDRKKQRRTG